ncbi:RNA polymerase subunit sigma-70 [Mycobacterium avium]|nr:RNA polymerase subunit sigma-70 [Mycobacterium avium]
MNRRPAEITCDWVGRFVEGHAGSDVDLERATDSIAAGRLLFAIADALAKELKDPRSAARAYRVLLARLEGYTFDQIARREGISRERVRQVISQIRRIVVARPGIFDGFSGLDQAARSATRDRVTRFENWSWRKGFRAL